jgi:hypothetical protein
MIMLKVLKYVFWTSSKRMRAKHSLKLYYYEGISDSLYSWLKFIALLYLCFQIGNWSRWLTDLFGIDDSDACEDENKLDGDKKPECETSFKAFHLLNALSDLMMLPFEMLGDRSTRKEVKSCNFNAFSWFSFSLFFCFTFLGEQLPYSLLTF